MCIVMLREALQRNAKHEARFSNISGFFRAKLGKWPEILRSAQDDNCVTPLAFWDLLPRFELRGTYVSVFYER